MKIPGKGVVPIILLLIVIPFLVDLLLAMVLPTQNGNLKMSWLLSPGYRKASPFYIAYLVFAFSVLFLLRKWKKSQPR